MSGARYVEDWPALDVPRLVRCAQGAHRPPLQCDGRAELADGLALRWRLHLPAPGSPGAVLLLSSPEEDTWNAHALRPNMFGFEWLGACYGCGKSRRHFFFVPKSGEGWCRVCRGLSYREAQLVNHRAVKDARAQLRQGDHAALIGALLSPSDQAVPVLRALEAEGVLPRGSLLPPPRWRPRRKNQ